MKTGKTPMTKTMSSTMISTSISMILVIIIIPVDGNRYCRFPDFIWSSDRYSGKQYGGRSNRKWIGRTEYVRADAWDLQQDITAREGEIVIEQRMQTSCSPWPVQKTASKRFRRSVIFNSSSSSSFDTSKSQPFSSDSSSSSSSPSAGRTVTCYNRDVIVKVTCLSEEQDGKFRVLETSNDETLFNCMRFKRVTADVLHIYRAVGSEQNEERLCYDEMLHRDDWPWIGRMLFFICLACFAFYKTYEIISHERSQRDVTSCPRSLQGGFDFTAKLGHTKQVLCGDMWRVSRLEIECMRGDGLQFYFPRPDCNPFSSQTVEKFECWATWDESKLRYVLFGLAKEHPRYILRLPVDMERIDELVATVYLSPVVLPNISSSEEYTSSSSTITWYTLSLVRSEPGVCFDESALCRQFVREGRCTNTAIYHYANYCKRSCGLCDFAPSPKAECNFSSDMIGYWVLYSATEREEVSIDSGDIRFSTLGRFICKSKHWEHDYYKVFSTFNNGCRPRYSCLRLTMGEGSTLQFNMSPSDVTDKSFNLCEADEAQFFALGPIRSWRSKLLVPMSDMLHTSCGLHVHSRRSSIKFSDGRVCESFVSDLNPLTCSPTSRLLLNVLQPSCLRETIMSATQLEFVCSALVQLSAKIQFLVTTRQYKTTTVIEAGEGRRGEEPEGLTETKNDHVCWLLTSDMPEKGGGGGGRGGRGTSTAATNQQMTEMSRVRCDTGQSISLSTSDDQLEPMHVIIHKGRQCNRVLNDQMDKPSSSTGPLLRTADRSSTSFSLKPTTPPLSVSKPLISASHVSNHHDRHRQRIPGEEVFDNNGMTLSSDTAVKDSRPYFSHNMTAATSGNKQSSQSLREKSPDNSGASSSRERSRDLLRHESSSSLEQRDVWLDANNDVVVDNDRAGRLDVARPTRATGAGARAGTGGGSAASLDVASGKTGTRPPSLGRYIESAADDISSASTSSGCFRFRFRTDPFVTFDSMFAAILTGITVVIVL